MRIKLCGDGCQHCNPDYYIDILKAELADSEEQITTLEARVSELEQQQSIVRARCQHYIKNESEPFDGWLAELKFIHSILITPPKGIEI
jgi:hypothetical protein